VLGHILAASRREVIDDDDVISLCEQQLHQVRTDEAGSARDEDTTNAGDRQAQTLYVPS
jgi:hypothetical protein